MRLIVALISCLMLVFAVACGENPAGDAEPVETVVDDSTESGLESLNIELGDSLNFLFLGHIYERFSTENAVDPRVLALDRSLYNGVWFGGDITPYSIENRQELKALDRHLNLSDASTLWARGNHDWKGHSARLEEEVFGQKSWKYWERDGLGVFCYNSALLPDECELKSKQLSDLQEALKQASDLNSFVLLSHHAMWREHADLAELKLTANAANGKWGVGCEPGVSFENAVWPKLQNLAQSGVQVVCLSGDAGTKKYKFGHWQSPEGIDMLISGIYNSFFIHRDMAIPDSVDVDQGIVFTFHQNTGPLTWALVPLDSLATTSHQ